MWDTTPGLSGAENPFGLHACEASTLLGIITPTRKLGFARNPTISFSEQAEQALQTGGFRQQKYYVTILEVGALKLSSWPGVLVL